MADAQTQRDRLYQRLGEVLPQTIGEILRSPELIIVGEGKVTAIVPNNIVKGIIERKYSEQIRQEVKAVCGPSYSFEPVVDEILYSDACPLPEESGEVMARTPQGLEKTTMNNGPWHRMPYPGEGKPIIYSGNRVVMAMADLVIQNYIIGAKKPPSFAIFGRNGAGKTRVLGHIFNSIWGEGGTAGYLDSIDFSKRIMKEKGQAGNPEEWMRDREVLLIDSIEDLGVGEKPSCQRRVASLMDYMGKRSVIVSFAGTKEEYVSFIEKIRPITPALSSRLERIADHEISPPEEDREYLLKEIFQSLGGVFTGENANLFAAALHTRLTDNIPIGAMQGKIEELKQYVQTGLPFEDIWQLTDVTPQTDIFNGTTYDASRIMMAFDHLLEPSGLSRVDIIGGASINETVSELRCLAAYALREIGTYSVKEIGAQLGKSVATIKEDLKKAEEADPTRMSSMLEEVRNTIENELD